MSSKGARAKRREKRTAQGFGPESQYHQMVIWASDTKSDKLIIFHVSEKTYEAAEEKVRKSLLPSENDYDISWASCFTHGPKGVRNTGWNEWKKTSGWKYDGYVERRTIS